MIQTIGQNLFENILEELKKQNFKNENIYKAYENETSILMFQDVGEPGVLYNLFFLIEDIGAVEVDVKKEINITNENLLELLKKTNALNAKYKEVSFFLTDKAIIAKKHVSYIIDSKEALQMLNICLEIASEEFSNFT